MESSTWVNLPLIFFPSSSLLSILFPLLHFSVPPLLTICRSSGGSSRSKQRIGVLYSPITNSQTPPYTLIFLTLSMTCTPLNSKEHIFQHKWVKQVILKHLWMGKRGVKIAHTSTWFCRFFSGYLLPFYVYAQYFFIIDRSMNIPQALHRGTNGCVRITPVSKNNPANQLSLKCNSRKERCVGGQHVTSRCNSLSVNVPYITQEVFHPHKALTITPPCASLQLWSCCFSGSVEGGTKG